MLRNVNDKGGGKFETCGLTSWAQRFDLWCSPFWLRFTYVTPVLVTQYWGSKRSGRSKFTQWQPKLSFYYTATILSLLGHTRFSGMTTRGGDDDMSGDHDVYIAQFEADSDDSSEEAHAASFALASRVWVVWISSQSGAKQQVTVPIGAGGGGGGVLSTAAAAPVVTLVQLVANSTLGKQSALQTTTLSTGSISVTVQASEKPILILLGVGPSPMSGPVPPIDAPVPFVCKRRDGSTLGPGLFCDSNASATPSGSYRVCPSGAQEVCPGDILMSLWA
jgi:hypothetical protein